MIRVVPDTNILISALVFGGLPETFLDLAFAGSVLLVTSPILLDELGEKLLYKFRISPVRCDQIRNTFERIADVVSATPSLAIIKDDPDDNRVLECARAGYADYIVSGDRHLLKLASFENISIVTVRQFMESIEPTS
jgi:putative PIN family toxin of toxin-antitoxin system